MPEPSSPDLSLDAVDSAPFLERQRLIECVRPVTISFGGECLRRDGILYGMRLAYQDNGHFRAMMNPQAEVSFDLAPVSL